MNMTGIWMELKKKFQIALEFGGGGDSFYQCRVFWTRVGDRSRTKYKRKLNHFLITSCVLFAT